MAGRSSSQKERKIDRQKLPLKRRKPGSNFFCLESFSLFVWNELESMQIFFFLYLSDVTVSVLCVIGHISSVDMHYIFVRMPYGKHG